MKTSFYIDEFITYLKLEKNCSVHTIESYRRDIADFQQFIADGRNGDFAQVTRNDVRAYFMHLYERRYARNTVSRKISALRSFYSFLMREAQVEDNPFAAVTLPKREGRLPTFLYEEEIEALLASVKGNSPLDQRDRALLALCDRDARQRVQSVESVRHRFYDRHRFYRRKGEKGALRTDRLVRARRDFAIYR